MHYIFFVQILNIYKKNMLFVINIKSFFKVVIISIFIVLQFIIDIFQRKEWLSSQLILSDAIPTIIQFDILPLIDIGGTLDIDVHLEIGKVNKYLQNLFSTLIFIKSLLLFVTLLYYIIKV